MKYAYFLLLLVSQVVAQKKLPKPLKTKSAPSLKNTSPKKIPGAVLAVKKGDKVILRKAYGYAKLKEFDGSLSANPEAMTVKPFVRYCVINEGNRNPPQPL